MNQYSSSIVKVVSEALYKTFMWVSIGLFLTGITSYLLSNTAYMFYLLHGSLYGSLFRGILIVGQIATSIALFLGFSKFSYSTLKFLFILFSVISGMTLSVIFLIYDLSSILGIFFITSGMFGALCLYGLLTKRDLTPFYTFTSMVLIGLIIFGFINIFIKSIVFNNILNVIGIFLFSFLVAADIQIIKKALSEYAYDESMKQKLSIIGAVIMYQNFINIFIRLLYLFGKKRDK